MNTKIQMGSIVKDTATDFTGIVTGKAEYLNSTGQYRVEKKLPDLNFVQYWFDEGRLIEIEAPKNTTSA